MGFSEALERFAGVNTRDVQEEATNGKKACPFVKWVGGKRSIVSELVKRMPKDFNDYYEAFVGGGALFFETVETINKAYLSDKNLDLILCYAVIKKNPSKLIELLKKHKQKHNEEYYYKIRFQHELQDPIEIAARFIYLNKTCYNGLYRVNKKGEFNVPVGKYANPNIMDEENLNKCTAVLQKADIKHKDFTDIEAKKGDFVYFDPPYHPTTETSFTNYTHSDFTEKDQERLRDFIEVLHKRGVFVMLSNSDTQYIKELYKKSYFNIDIIEAPRYVNCKPTKRNVVKEVLITNY